MAESQAILQRIRACIDRDSLRLTQHAHQEMMVDHYSIDDVIYGLTNGMLLENYEGHRRGSCCLVGGKTPNGRHIHIVCTTLNPVLIIITTYEPKPPKWMTPILRGSRS